MSDDIAPESVPSPPRLPEDTLRQWYEFAGTQAGFVGPLLAVLRERENKSLEDQCREFEVDTDGYLQLQGMALPRETSFAADTLRIAEHCGLGAPIALLHALNMARNLTQTEEDVSQSTYYEAAYDADGTFEPFGS